MSETPKEKKTVRKPVNEHASSYDKPVKKTNPAPKKAVPAKPAKKTTTAKVVDAVDAVVTFGEENPEVFKDAVEAVEPSVTDAQLETVLTKAPGFWAKVKQLLGV